MHINRANKWNDFHIFRTPLPHPKLIKLNELFLCPGGDIYNITKNSFHDFHLQAKCHYSKYPIPRL